MNQKYPYQNTLDVPSDVAENVSKEDLTDAIRTHRKTMSKLIKLENRHPSGLTGEHDVVLDAIMKECLHQ